MPKASYGKLVHSTPGAIRTPDTRFRKPLLYPSELQGREAKVPCFGAKFSKVGVNLALIF